MCFSFLNPDVHTHVDHTGRGWCPLCFKECEKARDGWQGIGWIALTGLITFVFLTVVL